MPLQDKSGQASPFEIITPGKSKKVGKTGIIVGIAIAVFLILSVVAGVLLVRQKQNVQEKAATSNLCPGAEACPAAGQPNRLWSCHPADSDGTVVESLCNKAGRVETCGSATTNYCCPVAGGSWTTDMSSCAVATAIPTATATATATAIPTATATATASATLTQATTVTPTPTATSSGSGNSCNGACGSNTNCQSGFYCYSGFCRNPLCASDSTCGCSLATATPTATASAVPAGVQKTQTTPLPIPVTGTDWATFVGAGVGVMAIVVSIILAL